MGVISTPLTRGKQKVLIERTWSIHADTSGDETGAYKRGMHKPDLVHVLALLFWSMAACTYHLYKHPGIVFFVLAKLGMLGRDCVDCAGNSVSENEFYRDAALRMFLWVVKCQVKSIFII